MIAAIDHKKIFGKPQLFDFLIKQTGKDGTLKFNDETFEEFLLMSAYDTTATIMKGVTNKLR